MKDNRDEEEKLENIVAQVRTAKRNIKLKFKHTKNAIIVSTVTKKKNRKQNVGRVKDQTSRRHLQEKRRVA